MHVRTLWLSLSIFGMSACSGEQPRDTFGDGAGRGLTVSAQAGPGQDAVLHLENGATVSVPRSATYTELELTLQRLPDARASQLVAGLEANGTVLASAPHVLEPQGHAFEQPITITLPVARDSREQSLVVLSREDAQEPMWRSVARVAVAEGLGSFQISRLGTFALVEDDGSFPLEDEPLEADPSAR